MRDARSYFCANHQTSSPLGFSLVGGGSSSPIVPEARADGSGSTLLISWWLGWTGPPASASSVYTDSWMGTAFSNTISRLGS